MMKTKLIPLIALLSMTSVVTVQAACSSHGSVDIKDNGKGAYTIDSDGNIVRDTWGGCVRTRDWNKDIAIARCEGWAESTPMVVTPKPVVKPVPTPAPTVEVEPTPVVAVEAAPVVTPESVVVEEPAAAPTLANFRGLFENNSAELKDSAHIELNKFADFMTNNPESKIIITGHTDSVGSNQNNQKLSEKRANAVKSYLESRGIQSNRMTSMGAGETSPVANNSTADGRAQNRRVAVELAE